MVDRADELLADYERLGALLLVEMDGSKAAALARERRMLRVILEGLGVGEGDSVVDGLAAKVTRLDTRRRGRSGNPGAPARGRQSG